MYVPRMISSEFIPSDQENRVGKKKGPKMILSTAILSSPYLTEHETLFTGAHFITHAHHLIHIRILQSDPKSIRFQVR